jgi:putative transposase
MKTTLTKYRGHRFPPEIISHSVWMYHRFCLSLRDVEELLAKRGILVTYETIRQWCRKFGPEYARSLKRRQGRLGDIWYLDEVFVKIRGERHYLWRAVDQDGDVIEILVQRKRNARAAKRFFRKLLKSQACAAWQLVTDKLKSYRAAHRVTMPSVRHSTGPVREQSSRGVASTHATTRASDAAVQVSGASTAVPVGPRGHSELLQIFPSSHELEELSMASSPCLQRLECGHGSLSKSDGSSATASHRTR